MLTRAFFAVVVIGCLGIPAAGQFNTGEIAGRVTDATGAVVPGVAVAATHAETGYQRERLTDQSGNFFLPSLPIGDYEVSAQVQGFQRATARVTLAIGQTLNVSLELQIGDAEETIVITEAAPLLQREDAEISDVIDNTMVLQTPLNGRQFLQLAQLTDGVVIPLEEPAATPCSRPARCRMSEAKDQATTFICSTESRLQTNCSTTL